MREPIACAGEGCAEIISEPKYQQRYCSDLCKLPMQVRLRRQKVAGARKAELWSPSREAEELFRKEALPCPFCGHKARSMSYEDQKGVKPRALISCCFGSLESFGEPAEIVARWNARFTDAMLKPG